MTASNRNGLAVESSILIRRATWCGIVFALALLITVLNCIPPISVHYRVSSQIVVSGSRLRQLQALAVVDREAVRNGQLKPMQLMAVSVLDQASPQNRLASDTTDEKVVLVEVLSLWTKRCVPEQHYQWLSSVTSGAQSGAADGDKMAEQVRFARWELEAAKHYAEQHEFLSDRLVAEDAADAEPAVTSAESRAFTLPSFSQPLDSEEQSAAVVPAGLTSHHSVSNPGHSRDSERVRSQLRENLQLAEQQFQQAEAEWQTHVEHSSGLLQIASMPDIAPRSTPIPFWMAASIIALGLAAGSTAGWLQHRLQSSGAYDPSFVADQLVLDGLPIVANIELPNNSAGHSDWLESAGRTASQASRNMACRLTQLSEWALACWVVLIVGRCLLDAVWRNMLIDSPLAALGRLIAGMP